MKRLALVLALLSGLAAGQPALVASKPCLMDGTGCFSTAFTNITGISASKLLGRGSSGAGAAQEITPGTGLTISGTTLTPDVSGSGASGRLALWSGAGTLTSDAGITYVGSGTTAGIALNADTSLSRSSAGVVGVGTGAAGSVDGSVSTAYLAVRGSATARAWITGGTPGQRYLASGNSAGWSGADVRTAMDYGHFGVGGTGVFGFTPNGGGGYTETFDAALSRISAGVVGVGTGAAGSVAGTVALVGTQGARTKTVTDATTTDYASFTIADGAMYSGEILYSCKSVKGTALQIAVGRVRFAATREGSTYTTQVNTVGTDLVAAASGTLACTMTIAGAAGVVTLSASCDTDQSSPDSMTLRYQFAALDPAIAITGL